MEMEKYQTATEFKRAALQAISEEASSVREFYAKCKEEKHREKLKFAEFLIMKFIYNAVKDIPVKTKAPRKKKK